MLRGNYGRKLLIVGWLIALVASAFALWVIATFMRWI